MSPCAPNRLARALLLSFIGVLPFHSSLHAQFRYSGGQTAHAVSPSAAGATLAGPGSSVAAPTGDGPAEKASLIQRDRDLGVAEDSLREAITAIANGQMLRLSA